MPVYTAERLPLLSRTHAVPVPNAPVIVSPVYLDCDMETSWGQILHAIAGHHYHICQEVGGEKVDHYPNDEYERDYARTGEADESDPRVQFLRNYWEKRGFPDIEVWEAKKIKPAIVVGVLSQEGVFRNWEGETPFNPGDVLLESPSIKDRMWVIKAATFKKKYGEIRDGDLPA